MAIFDLVSTALVVTTVLGGTLASREDPAKYTTPESHPFQASCKVTWSFGTGCDAVSEKLVERMTAMQHCTTNPAAVCTFSDISIEESMSDGIMITAQFASALTNYVEDITVKLYSPFQTPKYRCTGTGYSAARRFYTHSDHGGNYCTLYDLIKDDFAEQYGFVMHTDPATCTGYTDGKDRTNPKTYCS
ncbi:uncharacterized protein LOC135808286 [Sycon ciliatum]|uniref:uncharacterized protein LOC135808286 n=1 Tax=Sycon ciliatum TaxID=27933 RepID=UPI0031F66FD2|eukprot:scpid86466/ scgid9390/ 